MGEPAADPPQEKVPAVPAVIATAGHVDHGKSSLVRRLTGIDPDRLEEERRRGLTIELGYAWCHLPSGREIGFVDVPGHERFVRTMLAGVGPVRLVLFVVAADEGWKPQSEEHLEIIDVLGVQGAVVALTKSDLAEVRPEDEVRQRLRGTAIEDAPIVPCSTVTGEGLEALVSALDRMVGSAAAPEREGRARQHVDRVFAMRGAGTVVTGTLTGGPVSVGDEIELLPSGGRARVRGLQTHRRTVDRALPVSRLAVNLTGVERGGIERGEVLAHRGDWRTTNLIEARIRPVRSLGHPLTARGAFKLHVGSAERDVRLRLYGDGPPGAEGAFGRIALSVPVVVEFGDRFVLRDSGRRETVAGGVVLDADPPRRPGADADERLRARERATRADLPSLLVRERGAVRARDLLPLTGISPDVVRGAELVGGWWVAERIREAVTRSIVEALEAHHASDPSAIGEDIDVIRSAAAEALVEARAPRESELAGALVDRALEDGVLVQDGAYLRLASHRPAEPDDDVARLVSVIEAGGTTPPTVSDLRAEGFSQNVIDAAVRSGALVRISSELVLTSALVERAVGLIREAGQDGMTVSALRERLGTTRRFAVPLLEHLDRSGVTRREGDLRFARRG
ncbi:MAG TPA: selenocysteine-specific translation elongation factor [Actinomycetota bacterium]